MIVFFFFLFLEVFLKSFSESKLKTLRIFAVYSDDYVQKSTVTDNVAEFLPITRVRVFITKIVFKA